MEPLVKEIQIKSGFYPCIVYLHAPEDIRQLSFVSQINNILEESNVKYEPVSFLHISLTKTFHLLEDQVKVIVGKIRKSIQSQRIRLPLILLFKKVTIIDNFVTVEVHDVTKSKLCPMTKELEALTKIEFYQQPIFHISLFKIFSFLPQSCIEKLEKVALGPSKAYSLGDCRVKAGIVIHSL